MTGTPPYVGLAPFGEADADRFFGRDAERKRIIANLQASRFTLLYARSGVGKSSLLRAGVVARLAAASRLEPFIFSSWSGDPNVELPRALGGGDDLADALARRAGDGTLLVILDQFEEFFEYHHGTPAGERFADALADCVQRADLRVRVLVSIREDAYSRLGDEFKGRLPNVYSNYLRLDDLDERGARAAIEEPLRAAGDASVEPVLVEQVLRDVRRGEGSNGHARYETAHLQYVLRRLWDEETAHGSRALRLATLQRLGGSKAIFERHFEEAVARLPAGEQDALAKAFRYLVTASGTKRAESAADLAELAEVPQPLLERALEHLREARILSPVAADGQTRYELAHDLLAAPALEWRQARERARELRSLRRVAGALGALALVLGGLIVWALLEGAAADRQARRAQAQALVAESANLRSVDPEQSLTRARAAWRRSPSGTAEDALRRAYTASLVRGRLELGKTWRGALSADGDVVAAVGPGGVRAWRGLDAKAPARTLPGEDAVLSADGGALAAAAVDGVTVQRVDGGEHISLPGSGRPALSADGRYAAVVDADATLLVVDAATGAELARSAEPALGLPVLAFDPADSGRLLAGDCDGGGTVEIWSWRDDRAGTLPGTVADDTTIPRGGDPTCLLVVSPDGKRAAHADARGGAYLWDLERGRRVGGALSDGVAVRDLVWSAASDRLAIAAGKAATIVDRSGEPRGETPNQVDFVNGVAFNPSGELVVTSSRDGVARVWDVASAGMLAELRGHTDEIADAAFTASGRDVVTLSLDGTARTWRVVEGRAIRGTDWLLDAAYSPDGALLATAAADGHAQVQPLAGGDPVRIDGDLPLQLANSIAFDAEGRRVVVAGGHDPQHGQIVVADARTGELQTPLFPVSRPVVTAAFSPDGEWLVTTALDASAALWELSRYRVAGGSDPTATLTLPEGRSATRAEFSPDGRTIVVAANDGVARVYDARTHRVTLSLETPGLMYGARYSPDGRRILTWGSDFRGRIWDARTGARLAVLVGHSSWISRGAFSPDGRLVVTGSADQTTRVWDADTARLLSTQRVHGDTVNSVAFSPDGRTILSAGDDRAARMYGCATCGAVEALVSGG